MNSLRVVLFISCWSLTVSAADSSWTEKWNLKGDFRFRSEQIKDGANTSGSSMIETEKNRHRIRARLTAAAKVNDAVDMTFRLATGDTTVSGTTSTNQDMTGYGAKKAFDLDLAYANWHARETAQVWVGKSPIPYYQPGTSDLLLDGDITPEGVSYKDQHKGDLANVFWNFGYSILSEQHNSTIPATQTDVMMVGADLGVTFGMGDAKVTLGGGSLNFPNIKDTTQTSAGSSFAKGNSATAGTYTYEYKVTRGFLELTGPLFGTSIAAFFDYAKNSDPADDNTAQLYGVKVGQLKEVGDVLFAVDFRDVKKDASVGVLVDADSAGGGTDVKSTRYSLQYQLDKGVALVASYYDGKRSVSSLDIPYKKTQFDVNFAF